MLPTLKEIIRSRTREGWSEFVREKVTDIRIWIQENGEKAALLMFAVGLLAAVLFKLFIFILVLAVLFGYTVWYVAIPEEGVRESRDEKSPDDTTPSSDKSFNMAPPNDSSGQ